LSWGRDRRCSGRSGTGGGSCASGRRRPCTAGKQSEHRELSLSPHINRAVGYRGDAELYRWAGIVRAEFVAVVELVVQVGGIERVENCGAACLIGRTVDRPEYAAGSAVRRDHRRGTGEAKSEVRRSRCGRRLDHPVREHEGVRKSARWNHVNHVPQANTRHISLPIRRSAENSIDVQEYLLHHLILTGVEPAHIVAVDQID